ncbi:MAG: inositol 2-dehydrogenase [Gammaproteobacteria bacterium RIFCSPHIGHO2_12_FULL_43_28]|nr:MAG: inositol 2-dehydrogenase [Gammaproteobacteria bacterium RIFCSPHIGHO2_12_FULL_43_28]
MKKCRIGIIGAGRIGKLHAENIAYRMPQFQLMGMADPYLDETWAKRIGFPMITKNIDDLINHTEIDAILIASPSHLHVEQIMKVSTAGKAIFCEKPMGLAIAEVENALAMVNKNKTLLQIGFNRRFDPNFANIKKRVLQGAIGKPQIINITSRDPVCPTEEYCKTSGGMFMDMTIHDFDMARFLAGAEVTEVYAKGAVLINPDIAKYGDIDTAVIQLTFANGALGMIDNSRQAVYGYDQRAEVFGSLGSLMAHNQTEHAVVQLSKTGTYHSNPLYFFLERYEAAYLAEMQAFYHAWLNHEESPVSGFDGLQALKLAFAAKQSLDTALPVKLTEGHHDE